MRDVEQLDLVKDEFLLVANVGGVISIPPAENYVDFSTKMLEAPSEIDEIAKQNLTDAINKIDILSDVGIKIFMTASDLADNNGPYFPPAEFKRFIIPYLKRWSDYITSKEGYSVLHSDGDLSPYIDEIASSGITALQAIDPIAGMDMENLLQRVGHLITLCGNFDCGTLLTSNQTMIYNTTTELLNKYKSSGDFVFGSSNAVQMEINLNNYMAMVSAWKDFNKTIS